MTKKTPVPDGTETQIAEVLHSRAVPIDSIAEAHWDGLTERQSVSLT
jgi:hypothetical protein